MEFEKRKKKNEISEFPEDVCFSKTPTLKDNINPGEPSGLNLTTFFFLFL